MAHIFVENLSLQYPVYEADRSIRQALLSPVGGVIGNQGSNGIPHVLALDGISMELSDGDRLGLLGHNGAGKSTFIKVLGGVFEPTSGQIRIAGNSVMMVTTGIGLDPDYNAYENIRTCGLYLGLTPAEIDAHIDDIAEFTELGDFLKLPVKTYSSGMVVRLTFAITTALRPEVILMDEGLGAGDARFAAKAKRRLNDMIEGCSIMVLASHSTGLIQQMCNRCAILAHGKIIMEGTVEDMLLEYHAMSQS
jgi:ABC-2 type transport system ATP-binding protein